MIRPVPGGHDLQRLAVPSLGLGVVAALELHRSEVDEIVRDVRMPRAVEPAVDREDLLVQRIGLRVLAHVEVTVRELGEARRQVALEPGTAGLEPDCLLELLDCIGVPAGVLQDPAQGGDGPRHLRILPGEVAAEHRQPFPRLLLGLLIVPTRTGELGADDERASHVGVVGSERGAPQLERAGEQRLRLVEPSQVLGDAAERLQQLGLHRGLGLERLRLPDAAVDQVHHLHVGRGTDLAGSSLEQLEHELLDPLRPRRLGGDRVARAGEADRSEQGHAQNRDTDGGGDEDRPGVPPEELSGAVGQRVRPRVQRLAGEVMVEIADQRFDRGIAPRRIALHRGEAEHVEVRPRGATRLHAVDPPPARAGEVPAPAHAAPPRAAAARSARTGGVPRGARTGGLPAHRRRSAPRAARPRPARGRRTPESSGEARCASGPSPVRSGRGAWRCRSRAASPPRPPSPGCWRA